MRGLAYLGVSSDKYWSILIPIVMSNLSGDVRLQIVCKNTIDIWKIDELLDAIRTGKKSRQVNLTRELKKSVDDNSRKPSKSKPHTAVGGNAL